MKLGRVVANTVFGAPKFWVFGSGKPNLSVFGIGAPKLSVFGTGAPTFSGPVHGIETFGFSILYSNRKLRPYVFGLFKPNRKPTVLPADDVT